MKKLIPICLAVAMGLTLVGCGKTYLDPEESIFGEIPYSSESVLDIPLDAKVEDILDMYKNHPLESTDNKIIVKDCAEFGVNGDIQITIYDDEGLKYPSVIAWVPGSAESPVFASDLEYDKVFTGLTHALGEPEDTGTHGEPTEDDNVFHFQFDWEHDSKDIRFEGLYNSAGESGGAVICIRSTKEKGSSSSGVAEDTNVGIPAGLFGLYAGESPYVTFKITSPNEIIRTIEGGDQYVDEVVDVENYDSEFLHIKAKQGDEELNYWYSIWLCYNLIFSYHDSRFRQKYHDISMYNEFYVKRKIFMEVPR